MFVLSPKRLMLLAVSFSLMVALQMGSTVSAQLTKSLAFKDLVAESDQVVVGSCQERSVRMEGGLIVTDYKIKPSEFWKGKRTLAQDGTFTMTEVGGAFNNPRMPLGQYAPGVGSSDMIPGEDVLLFLADPKPAPAPKNAKAAKAAAAAASRPALKRPSLDASPRVVGNWQGRFSVITHPTEGRKMIARTNVSPVPGSPINTAMRAKLLKSQGVSIQDGAAEAPKAKSSLLTETKTRDLTRQIDDAAVAARQQHDEVAKSNPAQADEIYQFESVDAVKARVMRIAKGKK